MKLRLVLAIALLSLSVQAQVFKYGNGKTLEVEFVQEPPCPVKISVAKVALNDPDPNRHLISLNIENQSQTPIRAYAMVSGGNLHPTVHTTIFYSVPLAPGKPVTRGIWPNSQGHYYFFFDYILFEDGSVCGLDNHHRSIQISKYLEARKTALDRVKALTEGSPHALDLLAAIETQPNGFYLSTDTAGPPNPDRAKTAPNLAWTHLIAQLRWLGRNDKQTLALADKLEAETPKPPLDVKK